MRWSPHITPNSEKLIFSVVQELARPISLGSQPIRLQLQRLLGFGSTGTVYGATSDEDKPGLTEKNGVVLMRSKQ